jgi:hypothetical protein
MTYSKSKLNSSGDELSLLWTQFWIWNSQKMFARTNFVMYRMPTALVTLWLCDATDFILIFVFVYFLETASQKCGLLRNLLVNAKRGIREIINFNCFHNKFCLPKLPSFLKMRWLKIRNEALRVRVKIMLRLTVSRPVYLRIKHPSVA